MKNIFIRRCIAKVYQSSVIIWRVFCPLFLILAVFVSDIFYAEHDTFLVAGYGKTVCAAEKFTESEAHVTLAAVKTPVKRTGSGREGKSFNAVFSLAYVRLAIAALFAVIILSVKYALSRRKGRGRLRVVIEDSETVGEYRETELCDMPRIFAIGNLITCMDLQNEDVEFTIPLIGERLHIKNYSKLSFFKNGAEMPEHFSIIYGDAITFYIQKFDVTIVYLDE